jgi:two-component system, cell cycle response regulator DivK
VKDAAVVLLTDPNDDNRAMYVEYLSSRGFTVIATATAEEALQHALRADVIVTGMRLRGPIDGLEFVRRVRTTPVIARTPIIVMTASAFALHEEQARAAGCDSFLLKPCLPDRLEREIRDQLALHRPARPARAPIRRPKHRAP